MWSKDSLPLKRLPLQGQGPSLFLVGLTPLCPHRNQGGTSFLVLPSGLGLFKCSSVCRPCRQSTPSVTPHRLSGHLSVGHTPFVKGRHSTATHHETLFPSTGWKPNVLMWLQRLRQWTRVSVLIQPWRPAPPQDLRTQPSTLWIQAPDLRGSDWNDWLQALWFQRSSLIDLQVTTATLQGGAQANGQAKLGWGCGCQIPASQGCRPDASEGIGFEGSAHPSPSAETSWQRRERI